MEGTQRLVEVGKYCFQCSYEGNGQIFDSNGEIIWRVETIHFAGHPRYPYGFFRVPDFVIRDKAEKEVFRIKHERNWVFREFAILENGARVCTIRSKSILRNKYALEFADGQSWLFRMPLFTVNFWGLSQTRDEVKIRLRTHNIWFVLIDQKVDRPQLVAALAFIHRERLRSN